MAADRGSGRMVNWPGERKSVLYRNWAGTSRYTRDRTGLSKWTKARKSGKFADALVKRGRKSLDWKSRRWRRAVSWVRIPPSPLTFFYQSVW